MENTNMYILSFPYKKWFANQPKTTNAIYTGGYGSLEVDGNL
jgi:hypothetical protein